MAQINRKANKFSCDADILGKEFPLEELGDLHSYVLHNNKKYIYKISLGSDGVYIGRGLPNRIRAYLNYFNNYLKCKKYTGNKHFINFIKTHLNYKKLISFQIIIFVEKEEQLEILENFYINEYKKLYKIPILNIRKNNKNIPVLSTLDINRISHNYIIDIAHSYNQTPCWKSIHSKNNNYGDITIQYSTYKHHRAMYVVHMRNIKQNLNWNIHVSHDISHLCHYKPCVNPQHLLATTKSKNIKHTTDNGLCKNSKINFIVATKIRQEYRKEKISQRALAKRYNISNSEINDIIHNRLFVDNNYIPRQIRTSNTHFKYICYQPLRSKHKPYQVQIRYKNNIYFSKNYKTLHIAKLVRNAILRNNKQPIPEEYYENIVD